VVGEDAVFAGVPDEEGTCLGGGGLDEVVLGFISIQLSYRFVDKGSSQVIEIRAIIVFIIRESLLTGGRRVRVLRCT